MKDLHKKEIVSCAEMKELERLADSAGLSYYQMMERAGTAAADFILKHHEPIGKVWIFCGKGNNGGDGFVVARKFADMGIKLSVILVEGEPVTVDAVVNYKLIQNEIDILTVADDFDIESSDTIVDAIYGTGFHGKLRHHADWVIEQINRSQAYTAALDLPSGLPGDLQENDPVGPCVKANLTIAFHAEKPVHHSKLVEPILGKVVIADIGIGQVLS